MLEDEVPVEQDRLNFGQERVVLVDMAPPGLDHADFRGGEIRDQSTQKIRRRHEVGIEDPDELATSNLQPGLERSGLEPRAIGSMVVLDVDALRFEPANGDFCDAACLVRRVVEHLNLEAIARIIEAADSVDQAVGHVHLVIKR